MNRWFTLEIPYFSDPHLQNALIHDLNNLLKNGFEDRYEQNIVVFYCPARLLTRIDKILKDYPEKVRNSITIAPLENTDWENNWKQYIQPVHVEEFYVHPPWHKGRPECLNLKINPGMAFGTGTHPSTKCALQYISGLRFTGAETFLDVGTGSGILAFAAARKGVRVIWAVDIDPDIYSNFNENLFENKLAGNNINLFIGNLDALNIPVRFNYIVVNMLPQNFFPVREAVFNLALPGGKIFYSGFLANDTEEIKNHLSLQEFECISGKATDEWGSLILTRL